MDRRLGSVAILLAVAALAEGSACAMLRLPAVTQEPRAVKAASNAAEVVTVTEPMVWFDGPARRTSGVRLPSGKYSLEAEDSDYLYFRAPAPIDLRVLSQGDTVERQMIPGGLMLAKSLFHLPPAGVYIDMDSTHKMFVFKLGSDFLRLEGSKWRRGE